MHHSRNGFLTVRGYAENAQRSPEGPELAGVVASRYLDRVVSVSALIEIENDCEYDPNHVELNRRLILDGS